MDALGSVDSISQAINVYVCKAARRANNKETYQNEQFHVVALKTTKMAKRKEHPIKLR